MNIPIIRILAFDILSERIMDDLERPAQSEKITNFSGGSFLDTRYAFCSFFSIKERFWLFSLRYYIIHVAEYFNDNTIVVF